MREYSTWFRGLFVKVLSLIYFRGGGRKLGLSRLPVLTSTLDWRAALCERSRAAHPFESSPFELLRTGSHGSLPPVVNGEIRGSAEIPGAS